MRRRPKRDPLTGVLNRESLIRALESAIRAERQDQWPTAFVDLDVDLFKQVNADFGRRTGDQLLVEIGRRIGEMLWSVDSVGRIGGDEFGIVLHGVTDGVLFGFAERLRQTFEQPWPDAGGEVRLSASMGLRLSDGSGTNDASQMMAEARNLRDLARRGTRRGSTWATEGHSLDAREATAALRSGSLEGLRLGFGRFLEIAAKNEDQDERDLAISFAPFFDCARRLGQQSSEALGPVVATAPARFQDLFAAVVGIPEMTLAGFSWELVETSDGPAYRFAWPPHTPWYGPRFRH